MKPNDVSDRAWWFACKYQPNDLLPPALLLVSRTSLARSFDKATADLREIYELAPFPMTIQDDATLAAYTPGESE